MRNKNIKNDLNNLPQDFDQELIWSTIDLPKKKRRRFGMFWILGFFALIIGGSIFISSDRISPTNDNQLSKTIASKSIESKSQKVSSPLLDDGVVKEEKTASKIPTQKTVNFTQNKGIASIENIPNLADSLSKQRTSLTEHPEINRRNLSKEEHLEINTNLDIKPKTDSNIKNEINQNSNRKNTDIKTILNPSEIQISPIPTLLFQLSSNDDSNANYNLQPLPKFRNIKNQTQFGLSLMGQVGNATHDFGSDINRQLLETPLESYSLSILGHFIFNNLDISSGITMNNHNTQVKHTVTESVITNNTDGPVFRNITTQYSIYNSYQNIDLVLGLGYQIHLAQNWKIKPSIQVGYNLSYNPDGKIFNQLDELLNINQLDAYQNYSKWQGQANLQISRQFGDYWKIGLIAYYTTNKSLAKFEDISHLVSSKGIGLSIYRSLKQY